MDFDPVLKEMQAVFAEMPFGIEHTLRVLAHAETILNGESGQAGQAAQPALVQVITLAALLHDIGIPAAQRKYGAIDGPFQEIEGPPVARAILEKCGWPAELVERVCYIVGHHHSPDRIDGLDFQIVWEADMIEALRSGHQTPAEAQAIRDGFRTETGKSLAQ